MVFIYEKESEFFVRFSTVFDTQGGLVPAADDVARALAAGGVVDLDRRCASVTEAAAGGGGLLLLLDVLVLVGSYDAGADAVVNKLVLAGPGAGGGTLLGGLGAAEDGRGVGIAALHRLLDGSL